MLKMMLELILTALSPASLDLRLIAEPIKPSWLVCDQPGLANYGLFFGEVVMFDPYQPLRAYWVCNDEWQEPRIVATRIDLCRQPINNPTGCVLMFDVEWLFRHFPSKALAQQLIEKFDEKMVSGQLKQNMVEGCQAHRDQIAAALADQQGKT